MQENKRHEMVLGKCIIYFEKAKAPSGARSPCVTTMLPTSMNIVVVVVRDGAGMLKT